MRATIRDIALIAGVTDRTVSNVLAGAGKNVRADARARAERVMTIVREMGYRPNASAKSIRRGRFNAIGLLASLQPHRSNFPTQLWQGIDEALVERDMHLVLARMSDQTLGDEGCVPKILRELSCDGLLINYTHGFPPKLRELIEEYRVSAIWINSKQDHDCVYPDDVAAGQRAVQSLAEVGHRRIAFVTGIGEGHHSVSDRWLGCQEGARKAGIDLQRLAPSGETWLAPQRLSETRSFLRSVRPTAVITYGTMEALTVVRVAAEQGLKLPEDMSLVNIGSTVDSSTGTGISTVLVAEAAVGRRAVEMLLAQIDNPQTRQAAVAVPPLDQFSRATVASPKCY